MSGYRGYLFRRIIAILPVLWGVATLVFLVSYLVPGDPIDAILGEKAGQANVAQIRHELGLDQPMYVRYARFVWGLVHGDLGRSLVGDKPVSQEILSRLPATVELAVFGVLFSITLGLLVGVIAAVFRRGWVDYLATTFSLIFVSIPSFWLCFLLIILFCAILNWLPITGRIDPTLFFKGRTGFLLLDTVWAGDWEAFWNVVRHLILPMLAVNASGAAVIARVTRSSVLEVLDLDFVRTARAKGASQRAVVFRHVLGNALLPVVTVAGLQTGNLLGGAVITETIFSWPGVGKLALEAIDARDFPVVQGTVLFAAMGFVLVNLLVDLLYARLDPRITYD